MNKIFDCHKGCKMNLFVLEFDLSGPILFGKSASAVGLFYFMPLMCAWSQEEVSCFSSREPAIWAQNL